MLGFLPVERAHDDQLRSVLRLGVGSSEVLHAVEDVCYDSA
jgi:hypothetical protein